MIGLVFWLFAFGVSAVTLVGQVNVYRGKRTDVDWPLIEATTNEGRVAAVCLYAGMVLLIVVAGAINLVG